jgi:hypothetical protein
MRNELFTFNFDCGRAKDGHRKGHLYVYLHGTIKKLRWFIFVNGCDWFGWYNGTSDTGSGFHYELALFKVTFGLGYPSW